MHLFALSNRLPGRRIKRDNVKGKGQCHARETKTSIFPFFPGFCVMIASCRARAFAVARDASARQLQSRTKATHRMLASGGGVIEPFPFEFPLLELPACLKVGDASSTKPTIAVAMSGGVDSSVCKTPFWAR